MAIANGNANSEMGPVLIIQSDTNDGNTQIEDISKREHQITVHGNVHHSTDNKVFGNSSLYFDGTGDYLEITDNNEDLNFVDEDFTIDFWMKIEDFSNHVRRLLWIDNDPSTRWGQLALDYAKTPQFFGLSIGDYEDTANRFGLYDSDVNSGTWYHIALAKSGNTYFFFKNGTLLNSFVPNTNCAGGTLRIGNFDNNNQSYYYFKGWLDEIRITKGEAIWTENFDPLDRSSFYNKYNYLLSMKDFEGSTQTSVSAPIVLTNYSDNHGIEGIDLTVDYDPNVLSPVTFSSTGSILEGKYAFETGFGEPGKVILCIAANTEPFCLSSGLIGFIEFNVLAENSSKLSISEAIINEYNVSSKDAFFTYNHPPMLPTDSPIDNKSYTTNVNTPISIDFTVNDPDSSNLQIIASSINQTILPPESFTIHAQGNNITLTIEPAPDQYSESPLPITITISDGYSEISSNITLVIHNFYILAGEITYYTGTNYPIENVELTLSGNKKYTITSDSSGRYTFNNIEADNYTLTAQKQDHIAGLGADDATRIRRYKVGNNVTFDCYQMLAADVSRDGTISAMDASRVAIGSAKIDANIEACMQDDSCIHWIFVMPITAGCIDWPPIANLSEIQVNILSDILDLNLYGIRLGDVTGNWSTGNETITNSFGMTFILIPAGTFVMGSPTSELSRNADEVQHSVTLTQSFYLQETEVTQGQWQAVMGSNPSTYGSCGDECPVETINWDDAQAFIQKLNQLENTDKYRLPNEAEWEYAARAGSTTAYYNGDISNAVADPNLDVIGWYTNNSSSTPHPVGQKQSNAWGLYDMSGNVWEWCQDWYGNYSNSAITDPTGPATGSMRVMRGCSHGSPSKDGRSARRHLYSPGSRSKYVGLRILRMP